MNLDPTQRYVSRLTHRTLALVLAGGRGSRLGALTEFRTKPAVPFGGSFRIIDFTLSNCINSGIRRIGVLTQYKAHSLIRHIQRGWGFLRGEFGEFIELLPAQQRRGEGWYAGTADAVWQNIDVIQRHKPEFVLVLAGDHIYKMDYGPMIARHLETDAALTIGCVAVERARASSFGVMSIAADGRITAFAEKPTDPAPLPRDPERSLCSMGIYVFDRDYLVAELERDALDADSVHDFGRNIIPRAIDRQRVYAYPFVDAAGGQNYWRDVGTVDAFWEANLELTWVDPPLNVYDDNWPIWTYQEQLPPAKFVLDEPGRQGCARSSMVASGCVISGASIDRSLLFCKVIADERSVLEQCVVLPEVRIGGDCRIRRAVIDKLCTIAPGTRIGFDEAEDRRRFHVTPQGVVLVTSAMLTRGGTREEGEEGSDTYPTPS
jgi:glucose-1-phosphate adenylyltransferase